MSAPKKPDRVGYAIGMVPCIAVFFAAGFALETVISSHQRHTFLIELGIFTLGMSFAMGAVELFLHACANEVRAALYHRLGSAAFVSGMLVLALGSIALHL